MMTDGGQSFARVLVRALVCCKCAALRVCHVVGVGARWSVNESTDSLIMIGYWLIA